MKRIFDYYLDVSGHKVALKIATEIINSAESLSVMPFKASVEEYLAGREFVYRSLLVNSMFKIIYFIDEKVECVVIATIWDCRQDPLKLIEEIPT